MVEIRRRRLGFENHYTQVPNSWARDARLSRKARGLLTEILSHSTGWIVTESSLVAAGTEGRDSVRSGIAELIEHGYLVREQERGGDGKFGAATMDLDDPWSDYPQESDGSAVVGLSDSGKSADHIRRTIHKNNKTPEDQENTTRDARDLVDAAFADWYSKYPRKAARAAALKSYRAAAKKLGPDYAQILDRALGEFSEQMRAEGRDITKIAHPATWLNQERWTDVHSGVQRAQTAAERMAANLGNHDWSQRAVGQ